MGEHQAPKDASHTEPAGAPLRAALNQTAGGPHVVASDASAQCCQIAYQAMAHVYREKFGFPYIPDIDEDVGPEALRRLRQRLARGMEAELADCLQRAQGGAVERLQARPGQG